MADSGKTVVIALYATVNATAQQIYSVGGRIVSMMPYGVAVGGYISARPTGGAGINRVIPSHPLLANVNTFDG